MLEVQQQKSPYVTCTDMNNYVIIYLLVLNSVHLHPELGPSYVIGTIEYFSKLYKLPVCAEWKFLPRQVDEIFPLAPVITDQISHTVQVWQKDSRVSPEDFIQNEWQRKHCGNS